MKHETAEALERAASYIRRAQKLVELRADHLGAFDAYNAMFRVAQGLLAERGVLVQREEEVLQGFLDHLVSTGEWSHEYYRQLQKVLGRWVAGVYSAEGAVTAAEANDVIRQAREFLELARRSLGDDRPV